MNDCQGQGAGWGTIEGVRLRILLLASPDRAADAKHLASALKNHEVTLLSEAKGFLSGHLAAAKAARAIEPHLIHAVGSAHFAKAAGPVAAGIGCPLIAQLNLEDTKDEKGKKVARKLAMRADAVILSEEAVAKVLREGGVNRDVYVIATPSTHEDERAVLGALEVVYGRTLADDPPEAPDAPPTNPAEPQLVQIGQLQRPKP